MKKVRLSGHIIQQKTKLKDKILDFEPEVYGVTNKEGVIITNVPPSADLSEYILISQNQFVYNPYRINVGSIGLTPKNVIGVASPAYVVFETKETLETEYLFYYLKSSHGTKLIKYYGDKGGVRSSLSFDKLGEIEIPLPTLAQQETIVQKIKGFMATHSQAKATIEALQTDLKAYRKSILQEAIKGNLTAAWRANNPTQKIDLTTVNTRFDNTRFDNSSRVVKSNKSTKKPLPPIKANEMPFPLPKNWSWVRLGEIAEISSGSTPKSGNSSYYSNGTIGWITSSQTSSSKIEFAEKMITQLAVQDARLKIYPPTTLILALYGQGKTRGQVSELMISATINQALAAIQLYSDDNRFRNYIKMFLLQNYDKVREEAKGGSQPNLNGDKVKKMIIPLPPLTEQAEIVRILEEKMATIAAAEEQLKALLAEQSLLQKSMIQEVFRG
jgi:type I restriction enzyme, S subunit